MVASLRRSALPDVTVLSIPHESERSPFPRTICETGSGRVFAAFSAPGCHGVVDLSRVGEIAFPIDDLRDWKWSRLCGVQRSRTSRCCRSLTSRRDRLSHRRFARLEVVASLRRSAPPDAMVLSIPQEAERSFFPRTVHASLRRFALWDAPAIRTSIPSRRARAGSCRSWDLARNSKGPDREVGCCRCRSSSAGRARRPGRGIRRR